MIPKLTTCKLCSGELFLAYEAMKGYVEDSRFDIYVCKSCQLSCVSPLRPDEKVYESIYKNAEHVPGYERYTRYAELVKLVKDPLSLLANSESAYWSVIESIKKFFPKKEETSVLEIGSGLGYLTYALNKNGYTAVGVDISKDAVDKADKNFGSFYQEKNIFELPKEEKRYDCVIMMEVIEHVEDPGVFIEAGLKLLKPGGKLIVTTPNKSASSKDTIWNSDFPPVHLWFLTEESISRLAVRLNKNCEFFDYTEYSKKFYSPQYCGSIEDIQRNVPRLSKDGEVLPTMVVSDTKTKLFGLRGRYVLSYVLRRLKKKTISERSTTMCFILS